LYDDLDISFKSPLEPLEGKRRSRWRVGLGCASAEFNGNGERGGGLVVVRCLMTSLTAAMRGSIYSSRVFSSAKFIHKLYIHMEESAPLPLGLPSSLTNMAILSTPDQYCHPFGQALTALMNQCNQ